MLSMIYVYVVSDFSHEQDKFCWRRQAFASFQTWLPQVRFFRPEEAMFENWRKLVSSNKIDLVHEKNHLLTTLLKQDEKSSLT